MTTPAELGEKALRRLGVAIVPVASRPLLAAVVSVTAIAERALQNLGIVVSDSARPGFTATIPSATLATNALVELGVIASDEVPSATDQALALVKIFEVHDALVSQSAVAWGPDSILQAAGEEYTKLAALMMASSFGKTGDPAQWPILEARVKRISLIKQSQIEAEGSVLGVHDALVSSGSVSWQNTAIPQAVANEYVLLTVNRMAPLFGIKADMAEIPAMEARVRHFSMIQRAPDQATQAVMSVHQDLAARGKVRWSVFDIPPHVEDPYVMLAAYQLAPEFGMKPSADDAKIAEIALNRYIALPSSGERVMVEYF